METVLTISLRVRIADEGANLNEICAAAREAVIRELAPRVVEEIVEAEQARKESPSGVERSLSSSAELATLISASV